MTQMNPTQFRMMARTALGLALLAVALVVASCSTTSKPRGEATMTAAFQEGVPGGVMVGTYQETATVTAIDAAKRTVTLVGRDGTKTVFKASPEVRNFDQIRVGDQVKATVVEQLVVFLRQNGTPAGDSQASMVALAPKGAKPGVLMADTVEVTATVKAIDLKRHKATLQFPDGKSKTVAVRPDVDLTKVKLGEEVVILTTEAMAIVVERP
jgi:translation elongation factor P/translation initiation factor 5A